MGQNGSTNKSAEAKEMSAVLRQVAGDQHFPSSDPLWLDLLSDASHLAIGGRKVEEIDAFVLHNFTLQLLQHNDSSGNLPTFIRFFSKTLRAIRSSTDRVFPCTTIQLENLCEFVCMVIRQLVANISAPDILFHFEQAPVALPAFQHPQTPNSPHQPTSPPAHQLEPNLPPYKPSNLPTTAAPPNYASESSIGPSASETTVTTAKTNDFDNNKSPIYPSSSHIPLPCIRISYRGRFCDIEAYGVRLSFIRSSIVQWFAREFPNEVWILIHHGFAYRDIHVGVFTHADLPDRLQQSSFCRFLVLVPLALPLPWAPTGNSTEDGSPLPQDNSTFSLSGLKQASVLRELLLEITEFCAETFVDNKEDRHMMHSHRIVKELLITLFAVICPDAYGAPSLFLQPPACNSPNSQDGEISDRNIGAKRSTATIQSQQNPTQILSPSNESISSNATTSDVMLSNNILHQEPSLGSREAHSLPLYHFYQQAIQPLPNVFSSTVDFFSERLPPRAMFLDAYLETLALLNTATDSSSSDHQSGNVPPHDLSKHSVPIVEHSAKETLMSHPLRVPLSSEFLSCLMATVWLKGPRSDTDPSLVELLQDDRSVAITFSHSLAGLTLLALLIFHVPKPWEMSDLATDNFFSKFSPPSNIFEQPEQPAQLHHNKMTQNGANVATIYDIRGLPINVFVAAFRHLMDPQMAKSLKFRHNCQFEGFRGEPPNFGGILLMFSTPRIDEHLFPLILYAFVYSSLPFRNFCLSRFDDLCLVILSLLHVLHRIPNMCTFVASKDSLMPQSRTSSGRRLTSAPVRNDTKSTSVKPPINNYVQTNRTTHKSQPFSVTDDSDHQISYPAPPAGTLLMIVLFTFTQDADFCRRLHNTILTPDQVSWVEPPSLREGVSLGSITLFITLRLISWNFGHARDLYLHQICAAVLSNMAPYIENVHWYVAEKLVDYLGLLCRQLLKRLPPSVDTLAIDTLFSFPPHPQTHLSLSVEKVNSLNGNETADLPTPKAQILPAHLSSQLNAVAVTFQGLLSVFTKVLSSDRLPHNTALLHAFIRSTKPEETLQPLTLRLKEHVASTTRILTNVKAFRSYLLTLRTPQCDASGSNKNRGQEKAATDKSPHETQTILFDDNVEALCHRQEEMVPNLTVPKVLASMGLFFLPSLAFLNRLSDYFISALDDETNSDEEDSAAMLREASVLLCAVKPSQGSLKAYENKLLSSSREKVYAAQREMKALRKVRWCYSETTTSHHYFLPLIWKTAFMLHPNYRCWVRP